jgi:menaquinone-specific isochorismate synthase
MRFRTVPIPDPGDLLACLPDPAGVVWLRKGEGLVGWGEAARIDPGCDPEATPQTSRFSRAAAAFAELAGTAEVEDDVGAPGTGPVAFGSFTFDPKGHGSTLIVPRMVVARRAGRAWMTVAGEGPAPEIAVSPPTDPPRRVRYAGASMPDHHWLEAVATAIDRIEAGGVEKVVLARDVAVWSKAPFDPRALAARLTRRFPDCYTFACARLVGASPELLVRRTGEKVESLVLAGSAARGAPGRTSDADLGEALLNSKKDRAEHDLAVASVRERLADRCAALLVDTEPWLLRLANVQHLATAVQGRLRGPLTALELAGILHPTAAVCGTPTDVALSLIRELEGMDRGRYAGPVGWVDHRGDGEWAIALRCAELSGAQHSGGPAPPDTPRETGGPAPPDTPRARLFAGAGLVAGSLPEAELEETRLKLRAMQSAFERQEEGPASTV